MRLADSADGCRGWSQVRKTFTAYGCLSSGVYIKSYFVGVREGNGSRDPEEEAMSSDRIPSF